MGVYSGHELPLSRLDYASHRLTTPPLVVQRRALLRPQRHDRRIGLVDVGRHRIRQHIFVAGVCYKCRKVVRSRDETDRAMTGGEAVREQTSVSTHSGNQCNKGRTKWSALVYCRGFLTAFRRSFDRMSQSCSLHHAPTRRRSRQAEPWARCPQRGQSSMHHQRTFLACGLQL